MPEIPTDIPGVFATTCCNKHGTVEPKNLVSGTVGCWYMFNDGINKSRWYKETDDGTPDGGTAGWILIQVIA